jgi:very-short-patch-repair endonuclease
MRGQRRNGGSERRDSVVVGTRAVAALATRQSGVASRAQLIARGVGPDTVDRWLKRGALIAVHRGVYAVGHAALSPTGRSVAALLATGPDAVLSHGWAAAEWGILPRPEIVEVSVPRKLKPRAGLAIHTTHLAGRDLRVRDGLPITSPLRTLLDIRADERAIAEAQVLKLVTRAQLEAAGLQRLEAAPTRSELERAMLRIVRDARLPRPKVNARVAGIEADFHWPGHRLVAETDGWAAHGHRAAFEADRARDARLQVLGYSVLRFTWRQVTREPMQVAAVLAARLAAVPG